jgi:lysozyme
MVNFDTMKAAGAPGVIIRAGQNNWVDADFSHNWQAAKNAGLLRGAYWFYDSRHPPLAQAAIFASLLNDDPAEMEVWCDYEEFYGGAYAGWRHFAVFVAEIKRLLPSAKVGIYSGFFYWRDHSPNPTTEAASLAWFGQFALWIAWYADVSVVRIPAPWSSALYWQYTDNGDGPKYGTESLNVDLNYFNGSLVDFQLRYNNIVIPPDPDPEPKPKPVVIIQSVKSSNKLVDALLIVNYTIDGVPQFQAVDQRPAPEPEPQPTAGLYRIKSDTQAGVVPTGTRPYIRNGLPCTVRLQGGKGSVLLSPDWMKYAYAINTGKARNYQFETPTIFKDAVGWHNQQGNNRVEQVVFGGNVLEVLRIDGERAYIKTYFNEQAPPATTVFPTDANNPLVHNFSIQYSSRLDTSTDGRYARTLVIANPGEQLYLSVRELVKV